MTKTTRSRILQKCYDAIAEHGFCTLRTDKEIMRLKITKGAFYHYFPGKMELGYAVIDELLMPQYMEKWSSLENLSHGIAATLYSIIEREKVNATDQMIARGDVLCNLMVEMSHEDELFRDKLEAVLEAQVRVLQKAILAGKAVGEIKPQTDARSMAYSIIGQLQGCYTIAKTRKSRDVFTLMVTTLQKQMKELLLADTLPTGIPQRNAVGVV